MAINYPTSLDNGASLPYPSSTDTLSSPNLSGLADNLNDAIIALETKLGIADANSQTPVAGNLLASTANGESSWSVPYPASTIVGVSDTQTLTNKTIDFTNNTISNIAGANIASQSITATQIANATITATQIANNTITSTQLATSGLNLPPATYNPYKFKVYRDAAWNTPNNASATVIFDTIVYDTGSNYSTATGEFTAPIAGFYHFDYCLSSVTVASGSLFAANLYHNGNPDSAADSLISSASGGSYWGLSSGTDIHLAANDTVSVVIGDASGGAGGTGSQTSFSGYLISAT